MPAIQRIQARLRSGWLFRLLALIAFAAIVAANILMWPTTYLGYDIDPVTSTIVFVAPDSPAARAGVSEGDVLVRLYGLPWNDVARHWNVLSLEAPWRSSVALDVERDGRVLAFTLYPQPASDALQLVKMKFLLLGLCCWATGYFVGVARRHEVAGSFTLPLFWLALSIVLGTYTFTVSASWPLYVCALWLSVTFLAPLCVYMHLWYPPRPLSKKIARRGLVSLLAIVGVMNAVLLALIATIQPPLPVLYEALRRTVAPVAFSIALAASSVLLIAAYRRVMIAHIQRQIRIIAVAYIVVAACWLLALVLSEGLGLDVSIADGWLGLLAILIPGAYLYTGAVPNLRRVDRITTRLCASAVASVTITTGMVFFAGVLSLPLNGFFVCIALGLLFFYKPLYGLLVTLLIERDRSARVYSAFQRATASLAMTLDGGALIDILQSAVRGAFHNPAFAFYVGSLNEPKHLRLARCDDLTSLPTSIEHGDLAEYLSYRKAIAETRTLRVQLGTDRLSPAEQDAVYCPDAALWCPILHAEGHLLGLLVIGADPNLDPYGERDFAELHRLMDAAALAFTNSVAYQRQREAQETIRRLYTSIQQAQDDLATAIARELHDEIININVRLNIESLHRLLTTVHEPGAHAELVKLLESEQDVAEALRVVCERLQPSGARDEYGLQSLLRQHLELVDTTWDGTSVLDVEGEAVKIALPQQRETLHIVREAATNVIKHAMATQITVTLRYPTVENDDVVVTIHDNGTSGQRVVPKDGHWGLRSMNESAHIAQGEVTFRTHPLGGTIVTFTFPASA